MSEQSKIIPADTLSACIEGLIFISAAPVSITLLAETLQCSTAEVELGLHQLEEKYREASGLSLQWFAGRIQLTTSTIVAPYIERFLGLETMTKLTRPALETLTIIAYRQPITRPAIDSIRGVSSDGVLKSLLSKGLIQEIGRMDGPGRPILYGITPDFLQHFGLSSLAELPPYETMAAEEMVNNGILKD